MPDQYEAVRGLPFTAVATALDIDLSKFRQRKDGTEWTGPCPIHGSKKNNSAFSFAADGKWHCFSCEAKGKGSIDLCMAVRKVGFREAVEMLQGFITSPAFLQLAKRPVIEVAASKLPTENKPFAGTYEKFQVESVWLKARGFTPETLKHFDVFEYRNDKRRSAYNGSVMLKIRRYSDGECVGYLSRNIGEVSAEAPKYRFPANFQKSLELFGAFQLKEKATLRVLYLVESPFAVLAFHQKGFPAVSPFGWSLSEPQIAIVGKIAKGVLYLPDRDKRNEALAFAGRLSQVAWVKCPELPAGVDDPEQLSADQIRALS